MVSVTLSFDPVRDAASSDGWTLRYTGTDDMEDETSVGTISYHPTLTAAQTAQRSAFQADTTLLAYFTDEAEEHVLATNEVAVTNTYNGMMSDEGL